MSFQKMVFVAVFPLHSFTLTVFAILLTLSTSNGDDLMYKTCSSSFISCGNLTKVGYPFWGYNRPQNCGHPSLQLYCTDDQLPVLAIRDDHDEVSTYLVQNISSSSEKSQMTIRLHEYFPTTCPFHSFNKAFNQIFQLREDQVNITLFYDCPRQDMVGYVNCSIPCGDKKSKTYYLKSTLQAEPPEICQTIEVPVPSNELQFLYNETFNILGHGFEVDYRNSSACSNCQNSGGVCGSQDKKFACFHRKSAIPGAFLILAALNVAFWCCIKRKSYIPLLQSCRILSAPMKQDLEVGSSFYGIPVLPYKELQEATNNFDESQELGDGGFGIVYYGKLRDGREVAVKRLYEKNYKRIEQFMNEIEILTRLRHPNLVTLYGCTSRNSRELLLVYEFVPNGTVADHLYGERKGSENLSWDIRMKIAIGTARALSYLHASEIIHRDVKTNNILLDSNFSVKVADFGLSRLFPCDATHVSTVPQGTPGYLDPQYHKNYQVTSKSDVYSFGVVLVELISSLPIYVSPIL